MIAEEDYLRRITGFQRLCELSEVGIEIFCDSERFAPIIGIMSTQIMSHDNPLTPTPFPVCRQHIKEGIVLVDEENGTHFNLRTPRTVVQLLYGRRVRAGKQGTLLCNILFIALQ